MIDLSVPARYFPLKNGKYEVKAGLFPLGYDFGNGSADGLVFQLDSNFKRYHFEKQVSLGQGRERHFLTSNYSAKIHGAVRSLMIDRLASDFPSLFSLDNNQLDCALTGDRLSVSDCSLDSLALQVQEDVCVLTKTGSSDFVSALHVCFPNYWIPKNVVGKSFVQAHEPVPGLDNVNRGSEALINRLICGGPCVRFAWGLTTDDRLNHHLTAPEGVELSEWRGRSFDAANPSLYLRVERQVLVGMPQVDSVLFFIRTYLKNCREFNQAERGLLVRAIDGMSASALSYKGLSAVKGQVVSYLGSF